MYLNMVLVNTGSKLATVTLLAMVAVSYCDMMRKSIVFDKATPDVFYCPIDKPTSFEKMYVRSKPLSKLCEFNGKGLPEDYKSDCYADVDETEYACKEKKRIMVRLEAATAQLNFELLHTNEIY
ncbi:unnamed protein product [Meganyctiphanes norvegica]|uniref:Uncharacterized protein n=1 Tax=Meganyctiphanes norvegica TaxID=48144 RepID=A0AAV2SAT9_MEGNR